MFYTIIKIRLTNNFKYSILIYEKSDNMRNPKKAFVLGMARSGYEAAKLLINKGYEVVLNDIKKEQNPIQIEELKNLGVKLVLGVDPDDLVDDSFGVIVKILELETIINMF